MVLFLFGCSAQNAADRVRDHPFLVHMNDANADPDKHTMVNDLDHRLCRDLSNVDGQPTNIFICLLMLDEAKI